jgi:hypothetical protein
MRLDVISGFLAPMGSVRDLAKSIIKPSGRRADYLPVVHGQDEFSEYDDYNVSDWDGYGADPILPETVTAARSLKRMLSAEVRSPDIAPGAAGTIGFEWRTGAPTRIDRILIEIGPKDRLVAYEISHDGHVRTYPETTVRNGGPALLRQLLSP